MDEHNESLNSEQPAPEAPPPAEEIAKIEAPPLETPYPKDVRNWAMLCHLIALAGFLIPFVGNIVGPLVVWLVKKEESEFIDENGKEAVNFQISLSIYSLAASATFLLFCLGVVLVPAIVIAGVILVIVAAIKASDGKEVRYPLTIRFIK